MIKYDYSNKTTNEFEKWFETEEGKKALDVLNKKNKVKLDAHEMAVSFLSTREDEKLAQALLDGTAPFADYVEGVTKYVEGAIIGASINNDIYNAFFYDNHFEIRIYEEDKGEKIDFENDTMFRPDLILECHDKPHDVYTVEVKSVYLKENEDFFCDIIGRATRKGKHLHKADYVMIITHHPSFEISADLVKRNEDGIWCPFKKWNSFYGGINRAMKAINYQHI